MSGINVGRLVAGGFAAGILIWLAEGAAGTLYMSDMQAVMQAHNLPSEIGATAIAVSVVMSLITGFAVVFFYAAARPRFGPGPKTAVLVGVVVWLAGYFVTLLGYETMELFPTRMLALWAVIGLVELIVAATLGAWIYREA